MNELIDEVSKQRMIRHFTQKYDVAKDFIEHSIDSGINQGLSMKEIEIGLRMVLGKLAGGNQEFFTVEDIMEVTGTTREEVVENIELMIDEAKQNGENPEDYVTVINKDLLN